MWVVIEEDVVPEKPLNLNSTNLPRPWSQRETSPSGKIPTLEMGIEPGTSWLWALDHEAGRIWKVGARIMQVKVHRYLASHATIFNQPTNQEAHVARDPVIRSAIPVHETHRSLIIPITF